MSGGVFRFAGVLVGVWKLPVALVFGFGGCPHSSTWHFFITIPLVTSIFAISQLSTSSLMLPVPSLVFWLILVGGLSPSQPFGSLFWFSNINLSVKSLPTPAPIGAPITLTTPAESPKSTHV